MALTFSILALIGTFFQLYQQRVHNVLSVRPLVQMDLKAQNDLIFVRVQNNGLGPFIIEKLSFKKDSKVFSSIRNCISLDPKSYHNVNVSETAKKVILPNSYLDIFSVRLSSQDTDEYIEQIKNELSVLKVKVYGRDIYNNRIDAERDLDWFVQHH